MKILAILAVSVMLAACQTTGGRGGAFCDVERPIRPSPAVLAAMSHDELAAAVAHNRQGAKDCGWKAQL